MASSSRFLIVFVAMCVSVAESLTCYDSHNGTTYIKKDPAWTYCGIAPALTIGSEVKMGGHFGIGIENDDTTVYETAFGAAKDDYRILTLCVYERYDFTRYLSPPVMQQDPNFAVEFTLRCICNYDLCNEFKTFSEYLSSLKKDSLPGAERKHRQGRHERLHV